MDRPLALVVLRKRENHVLCRVNCSVFRRSTALEHDVVVVLQKAADVSAEFGPTVW
jgi:hypothetical protein